MILFKVTKLLNYSGFGYPEKYLKLFLCPAAAKVKKVPQNSHHMKI